MKKWIVCLMAMLMLCVCTGTPVHADEDDDFVPSITYKPAPEFVPAGTLEDGTEYLGYVVDDDGNILECVYPSCVIVTSLEEALDSESQISEDIRTLLVDLYNKFLNDEIKLSEVLPELNDLVAAKFGEPNNADNLVIKDLFDVDFHHAACETALEKDGTTIDLVLDVDIEEDSFFSVIRYKNGQWELLEDYKNNNDGTITITSESFCPVAVLVPGTMVTPSATSGFNWLYVIIPAALVVVVLLATNKSKKA